MRSISIREKILVGVAGGALAVFIIIMVFHASGKGPAGPGATNPGYELDAIQDLADRYAPIKANLAYMEGKIKRGSDASLLTTLEGLASPLGITIDEAINRSKPANPFYKEEAVEISLRGITLQQLTEYLLALRDSQVLLSAKSANIKRRARDATLLDVTLEISTFKPL